MLDNGSDNRPKTGEAMSRHVQAFISGFQPFSLPPYPCRRIIAQTSQDAKAAKGVRVVGCWSSCH